PEETAAQAGDLGEHGEAEHVEVLADGQQRTRDREGEDADQIERVQNGRAEQLLEHLRILSRKLSPALQSKAGDRGAGRGGEPGSRYTALSAVSAGAAPPVRAAFPPSSLFPVSAVFSPSPSVT